MNFPDRLHVVVTKSSAEFLDWCARNSTTPKDLMVRNVLTREDLAKLRGMKNCIVEYYGQYWQNPNFGSSLLQEIQEHN